MNGRDGRIYPACAQGHVWRQSGNRTGHCSACHRTFDSGDAFDAHQRISDGVVTCLNPSTATHQDGRAVFEVRAAGDPDKPDFGTRYWRIALTDAERQRLERLRAGGADGSGAPNGVQGSPSEGDAA